MYSKLIICFLLTLPFIIVPVLSGDGDEEYYYDYEEVPIQTGKWKTSSESSSESSSQGETVYTYYEGDDDGQSKASSQKKSKSSSRKVTKTVVKSSAQDAEEPDKVVIEKEGPRSSKTIKKTYVTKQKAGKPGSEQEVEVIEEDGPGQSRPVKKTIIKKEKAGKPASFRQYEEPGPVVIEDEEEPRTVKKTVIRKGDNDEDEDRDDKPKEVVVEKVIEEKPEKVVVVEKPKRTQCTLEAALCRKDKRCEPSCIKKLFESKEQGGLFSFIRKAAEAVGSFIGHAACYTGFLACNALAKWDLPFLTKCGVIDWPALAQGRPSDCFNRVFCQAEPTCVVNFDGCLHKVCGDERWNNFKKCALKD